MTVAQFNDETRPGRVRVHELRDKLKFLARLIGVSRTALARKAGIPPTSLSRAVKQANPKEGIEEGDSELGRGHCENLGKLFGFLGVVDGVEPIWREWIDLHPEPGSRKDTAAAFRAKYLEVYGNGVGGTAGGARPRSANDAPLIAEQKPPSVRVTTDLLQEGEFRNVLEHFPGLASLKLCVGNTGRGETVLSAEIDCNEADVEVSLVPIVLRAAIVSVACGKARAKQESITGRGTADGHVENGSHGPVHWVWRGNSSVLRWRVHGKEARIGNFSIDLAKIVELAIGDVLRGSISAWLKHIEPATGWRQPNAIAHVHVYRDEPGRYDTAEDISTAQVRLMEHLRKMFLKTDDNNYAELSSHEIEFIGRS
jgi:hypothetical protein